MRPTCKRGGCSNPCKTNNYNKDGSRRYHKLCSGCAKKKHKQGKCTREPRIFLPPKNSGYIRKDHCEHCGFVPLHMCQLDADHIDGNHNNNDPSNLQTLCANCHRLKTWSNRDNIK